MEKVRLWPSVHIVLLTVFTSSCVGWYPNPNFHWRPRQSESYQCPASRGQFSHPRNCDQFLNCWDFVAVVGQCQPGLVFNEPIAACDYPRNVDCTGKQISHMPPPPSPAADVEEAPPPASVPQRPVAAGTPTLAPTLPLEPVTPGPVSEQERPPNRPQHPLRPKPPLGSENIPDDSTPIPSSTVRPPQSLKPKPPLDAGDKPIEPSPDPSTPQLQEPEPSSTTRKPTVNLQPKPPLKPEDSMSTEKPSITLPSEAPSSVPSLNPSTLRPPTAPGPSNVGPSTTAAPGDGVDDPHVLFPFLPQFPEIFRCPAPHAILPIVNDCESVIICMNGIAHNFRCHTGSTFDVQKGRCTVGGGRRNSSSICGVNKNVKNPKILYAYLPLSRIQTQLS